MSMYTPRYGYPDEICYSTPNRTFGGVAIGIILFGLADYPIPVGCLENAGSFKYPVHFRDIPAATTVNVVKPGANSEVLEQIIGAAKEFEKQGCRAVIGGCGYFANYLPEVREQVNLPVYMSSLQQLPMIFTSLPKNKKIGVICADATVLPKAAALANIGLTEEQKARLVIDGGNVSDMPEMNEQILKITGQFNPRKFELEVTDVAKKMKEREPDIAAFLMECSMYPMCSASVQEATRLPVYDFITMIDWVESAVVQKPYYGYF